jgi:hypothetical protein
MPIIGSFGAGSGRGYGQQGGGGNPYIEATGGTITTCGDYKIHTFTGPGTFCVSKAACCAAENVVSYMVVAGGGGGGRGGGAGAGGFREYKNSCDPYTASPLNGNPGGTSVTVCASAYPITVGAGGGGATPNQPGQGPNGNPSIFSTITSAAGGGGGGQNSPQPGNPAGLPGGSGGGGGGPAGAAGSGNTPPTTPPQGLNGAAGRPCFGSGGGGGATGSPQAANNQPGPSAGGGYGGDGAATFINPSTCVGTDGPTPGRWFAGGGQGAPAVTPDARGGRGGGGWWAPLGTPRFCITADERDGKTNTGGGGGAEYAGGSGIVIIRYRYQ